MPEKENVAFVVKSGLCHGCGACVTVCSHGQIVMTRGSSGLVPRIGTKCDRCGCCVEVCPGLEVKLSRGCQCGSATERWLGSYEGCYLGYACDREVRHNSSSGGCVTALLIGALREGLVKGALVTVADESSPFSSRAHLALNESDVRRASGSRYTPVALLSSLRELSTLDGWVAIVGLPCHLHGLAKLCGKYQWLQQKVRYRIGLFCSRVPTEDGSRALVRRLGVEPDRVRSIQYRGDGWPGWMTVVATDGTQRRVRLADYWSLYFGSDFFTVNRCLVCPDVFAESADISLGDPWLPELKDESLGMSIVVSRSPEGESLVRRMAERGYVVVRTMSAAKVIESQLPVVVEKKVLLGQACVLQRTLHGRSPSYAGLEVQAVGTLWGWLNTCRRMCHASVSRTSLFRRISLLVPRAVLMTYNRVCAFVRARAIKSVRHLFE